MTADDLAFFAPIAAWLALCGAVGAVLAWGWW